MTEVKIITPGGMFGASASDDLLDTAMRVIGVGFGSEDEWPSKYGTDFENDVFMMHRYCWCDREDCQWCAGTAPNFRFKPSSFQLTWYKYIGRGIQLDLHAGGADIEIEIDPAGMIVSVCWTRK